MKIFASIAILMILLELVRKRKLGEEYSVLWVLGFFIFLFIEKDNWMPFAIYFLIAVNIYLSVQLSQMSVKMKNLIQKYIVYDENSNE